MGPSPFSDGRCQVSTKAGSAYGILQWGHRLSAMEGTRERAGSRPHFCTFNGAIAFQRWKALDDDVQCTVLLPFNGAIAFQRWKDQRKPLSRYPCHSLQWGHRLSAMEGPNRQRAHGWGYHPSMGPSPFSDGRQSRSQAYSTAITTFNGAIAFQRWKVSLLSANAMAMTPAFNGAIAFQRWKVRER